MAVEVAEMGDPVSGRDLMRLALEGNAFGEEGLVSGLDGVYAKDDFGGADGVRGFLRQAMVQAEHDRAALQEGDLRFLHDDAESELLRIECCRRLDVFDAEHHRRHSRDCDRCHFEPPRAAEGARLMSR